jgi:hypothetical protein
MSEEDYTPRPKASQAVAAKKRARQDMPDDTPTRLPQKHVHIALGVGALLLIGMLTYGMNRTPARPMQSAPTDAPVRAFVPTAVTPQEPPRATEAPQPTLDIPTPTTAPPVAPVEVVPQTGQGMTVDVWVPPAPVVVEPLPVAPTAVPLPTSAPVVAAEFVKPDIRGTCQFIDCLGAKAVDLERAQACHALYWVYGDADPERIPEPDYSAVRGCVWEGLYR